MDVVVLALRVVISLGVVLALLFVLHRRLSRMSGTRAGSAIVSVVARQGIGAKASVVVLDAEGTRFYLGVTEQSVSVLHSAAAPRALQVVTSPEGAPAQLPRQAAMEAGTAGAPAGTGTGTGVSSPRTVPATVDGAGDAGFAASLRLATSALPAAAAAVPAPHGSSPPQPGTRRAARAARAAPPAATPLQGSILSPATWRQTASFLRQGRAG
ncbi:FliO/MopB family protein [Arthrobacter sp. RIT-PI-e]|uniref:FliO/MopB family protein n=1 Tax=Arthrobacter sp. RIT-PI-e TaxID=1681197 RepID=UPI000676289D|nr:flagellar biosynthetic protein FliO [Arthrobacter sp. RIT-PI-e]